MNRRRFLGNTAAMVGTAGLFGNLAMRNAFAADTEGYKAMVCVFLFGGLDQNDTILPMDRASYDLFAAQRTELMTAYGVGSGTSSRDLANILPLAPLNASALGGREFGLPRELQSLKDMFDARELAVMGSVGPLVEPITRAQFSAGGVALPPRLFSHNDQQSTWMTLNVEGATRGWGGRLLDATLSSNGALNPTYMGVTASGDNTFLTGDVARGFNVAATGPVTVNAINLRNVLGNNAHFDAARDQLRAYLEQSEFNASNVFERDAARLQSRGVRDGHAFAAAYNGLGALSTSFPRTDLGAQLRTVAETISIRDGLDAKRQVFFVGINGFDTHSDQAQSVPALHTELADGIKAFRDAMVELNLWNDVTLFSASDFGRTLNDNGDGTDHGWGGHHFVAGGSVQGGRVFGDLPGSDTASGDYTDIRGRLIPTTAVEQYAATLGAWFGLDQSELARALPNLGNFNSADLGFMV
ncbi:MAG: DUF1501 domain-containing protein [Gammaproteobacteria bacterium]